jgi:hypothetical protein
MRQRPNMRLSSAISLNVNASFRKTFAQGRRVALQVQHLDLLED